MLLHQLAVPWRPSIPTPSLHTYRLGKSEGMGHGMLSGMGQCMLQGMGQGVGIGNLFSSYLVDS